MRVEYRTTRTQVHYYHSHKHHSENSDLEVESGTCDPSTVFRHLDRRSLRMWEI